MKRTGAFGIATILTAVIIGCGGGGIQEGAPPGPLKVEQPTDFRAMMEKSEAKKAQMKKGGMSKKPSSEPAAPPEKKEGS